jgi:hypothetical protein
MGGDPCGQYCSNKKNDKIQELIRGIKRREGRLIKGLAFVLAIELFEDTGVGP